VIRANYRFLRRYQLGSRPRGVIIAFITFLLVIILHVVAAARASVGIGVRARELVSLSVQRRELLGVGIRGDVEVGAGADLVKGHECTHIHPIIFAKR